MHGNEVRRPAAGMERTDTSSSNAAVPGDGWPRTEHIRDAAATLRQWREAESIRCGCTACCELAVEVEATARRFERLEAEEGQRGG
jgi:hypothetical protein